VFKACLPIAIPALAPVEIDNSPIAIGETAISGDAAGDGGTIAIGELSISTGASAGIAIGRHALNTGTEGVAIGSGSSPGIGANASAYRPVAIGTASRASGDVSLSIGGGSTATQRGAVALGGISNASSGAGIAIGENVSASAHCIAIGGNNATGDSADCSAQDAVALGQHIKADDIGEFAFASGEFAVQSDAHRSWYVLRNQTTNATQTELFADASAGDISVGSDCSMSGFIRIVARRTDADGETAHYTIEWTIDNNAGTTALVGAISVVTVAEDTAAWSVTATADNSNDGINILVTGEASKTIRWVGAADVTYVCG